MEFSNSSGYLLLSADGLTEALFEVETQKNAGQDGESYAGSTAQKRNIFLMADITSDYLRKKDFLYSFFAPRQEGELTYIEDGVSRRIEYLPESVSADLSGTVRTISISLICPDPMYKALEDETYTTVAYTKKIHWPLVIPQTGKFEVTTMRNGGEIAITNPTGTIYGMTVVFTAISQTHNPGLQNLTTGEGFGISCAMPAGSRVTVTTGYQKKRVSLSQGGGTQNINNLWDYGSDWLQVPPGTSVFQLTGDSTKLALDISVTPTFWGT